MSVSEANPKGNLTLTLLLRSYVHFYTTSGVLPVRAISHWRDYSRELFARTCIHTDASDQVARQNTLTSFLTFITDL